MIVDDEAPARAKLRKLLAGESELEIIGEAVDGEDAVEKIRELEPDLVFLDIQMPKRDGFSVIDAIGVDRMPLVVFVTAYDEHALRAFEVQALDYLLKPFAPKRFHAVVGRAKKQLARQSGPDLAETMKKLLEMVSPRSSYMTRIQVQKEEDREIFLSAGHIDFIRSERNYVRFFTADGEFVRRATLTEIEQRLDPEKFRRISRTEIIRLDAVKELNPWFHGDYHVQMRNGQTLTWSRRYRAKQKGEL